MLLVVHHELVDRIDVVTEEAYNPFVRAFVLLAVHGPFIVLHQCTLPLKCFLESTFKSDRLILITSSLGIDYEVHLTLWKVIQSSHFDIFVRFALLEHNLIFETLLLQRNEAEIVLFVESLEELFRVAHSLVSEEDRVILWINDKNDRSAQDVVVAQVLVDWFTVRPSGFLSCLGGNGHVGVRADVYWMIGTWTLLRTLLTDDELDGFKGHQPQAILRVDSTKFQRRRVELNSFINLTVQVQCKTLAKSLVLLAELVRHDPKTASVLICILNRVDFTVIVLTLRVFLLFSEIWDLFKVLVENFFFIFEIEKFVPLTMLDIFFLVAISNKITAYNPFIQTELKEVERNRDCAVKEWSRIWLGDIVCVSCTLFKIKIIDCWL